MQPPISSANAIQLSDLVFSWPGAGKPTLSIPEFHLEAGQAVFLRGKSGSGKSTLLSLLCGVLAASPGTVTVLGTDLATLSSRKRDRFRAANIGIVFQQFNLVPFLTVEANLRLAARFGQGNWGEAKERAIELLATMNLESEVFTRRADQLSVGQQQRVAIARAFLNQPRLVLADEPTSALDSDARDQFIELLLALKNQTDCAVLFASHDNSLARHFDSLVELAAINSAAVIAGEQEASCV